MTNEKSLISFPCDFQIKVFGKSTDVFLLDITNITRKYYPETLDDSIRFKLSAEGNYCSISITVYCKDQSTLDALYVELTQHPDVKMVL